MFHHNAPRTVDSIEVNGNTVINTGETVVHNAPRTVDSIEVSGNTVINTGETVVHDAPEPLRTIIIGADIENVATPENGIAGKPTRPGFFGRLWMLFVVAALAWGFLAFVAALAVV